MPQILVLSPTPSPLSMASPSMGPLPSPPVLNPEDDPSPVCVMDLNKKTSLRKKSVSFCRDVRVYPYRSALSLVNFDNESLWYSQEETDELREKTSLLVRFVQQQQGDPTTGNSKQFCTRGLEKMLDPCYHYTQRMMAKQAVLSAQKMLVSDEGIADIYFSITERSQQDANRRAAADARKAGLYLRKMRLDMEAARETIKSARQKHCRLKRKDSLRGLY